MCDTALFKDINTWCNQWCANIGVLTLSFILCCQYWNHHRSKSCHWFSTIQYEICFIGTMFTVHIVCCWANNSVSKWKLNENVTKQHIWFVLNSLAQWKIQRKNRGSCFNSLNRVRKKTMLQHESFYPNKNTQFPRIAKENKTAQVSKYKLAKIWFSL